MKRVSDNLASAWTRFGPEMLPFADAASKELPLHRLLRLSLFQVSVGMAVVLLTGTLNRVMIVELGVPSWLIAVMVSLPLVFAPLRALIGFRSDHHRSVLGWRRVPYIWFGTLMQFGGLAIMPFALLVLSGAGQGPVWVGVVGAALAFLLTGAGMHTAQTAGLALAGDLAPEASRPRVIALLYVMLLLGMIGSSLIFALALADFDEIRLIRVIQGAALATMILNGLALWKQEARDPERTAKDRPRPAFREAWRELMQQPGMFRFLLTVGLGSAAFSMQDILLEPYGAEVLGLSVSATTILTALLAGGALAAFTFAARALARGSDPHRLAAGGLMIGIVAFTTVLLAAPTESGLMFRVGTLLIGFGGGLFAISTLTAAMGMGGASDNGLVLGAWGAVQATAIGTGIALGGGLRDFVDGLAVQGHLGETLTGPAVGYGFVYQLEIILLFVTLAIAGPLTRPWQRGRSTAAAPKRFGLDQMPG
ncbi:BCD family MFS transporter [Wenzhouxiangella sp. XN79A]|uniref:BCD family MFS transporter n=1 Tax=Wenzhouxiangella sp. XN79A TaxID=2724193 RepID=UPI00144A53CB|nr:BCD family MFS transporter [Wenzhouxiangella sp. XN79A]NKI34867.1 BCD family MFS transporter [Wenzhouxiangella sp. XN79A]